MMKIISVALFSTLFSVSVYAEPTECIDDGKSVVVLPDCTTIEINTCYKGVPQEATSVLPVVITDLDTSVDPATPYCGQPSDDFVGCVANGNLAADVRVDDIRQRNDKVGNATPAKNGKKTATVDCLGCDGRNVAAEVDMTDRKNAHFDLLLEESDDTAVCKVGFNAHSQSD